MSKNSSKKHRLGTSEDITYQVGPIGELPLSHFDQTKYYSRPAKFSEGFYHFSTAPAVLCQNPIFPGYWK